MSNLQNRTLFNKDNLDILKGINTSSIDLIYLDPPFNKNKKFTAPIGSSSEGASFKDYWSNEDLKGEWVLTIKEDNEKLYNFLNGLSLLEGLNLESIIKGEKVKTKGTSNFCYLSYMAIRLIEMKRILKETGSIYLHCDNTMGHYLKILMDIIFGEDNFKNQVIWHYFKPHSSKKNYPNNYDNLFFYTKSNEYFFNKNAILFEYDEKAKKRYDKVDDNGKRYKIYHNKDKKRIAYLKEGKAENIFKIPFVQGTSRERTGYPTQKPLALLERIIKASSKEGDIVLDPFCGCATTCVASEKLKRQWVGIDISHEAYDLVKIRLKTEVQRLDEQGILDTHTHLKNDYEKIIKFDTTIPKRTDGNGDDETIKKYVYIISHPKYKEYRKVGIASDCKSRLSAYQTSDPNRQYKLEHAHKTEYFRELESHIHKVFDNLFEWVKASTEEIIKEIKKYEEKIKK